MPAELYDGERRPLGDDSVDAAILLEVIEHQSFGTVPIEFSHMLDVDHR